MPHLKPEYIEKIYAGWLAKIIGIRMGAPVEGWTYARIKHVYGALQGYPVDYRRFAADDDSNGPLFFLRALEDSGRGADVSADDVGEALLNYVPFEHGFFWWGGYGCSTEHTAYLNLRAGISAPRSGSMELNGSTAAEQIGGQIFIDTWGLAAPANPGLAAALARRAASVTHDGDGVLGGVFVAACISCAFEEHDIPAILEKGLSYLPADSRYAKVIREVTAFHAAHPDSWEDCFQYVKFRHGYDKYPGNCHIIPNTAVMILALLYGNGDFSGTLNICNRCGWDTDCNVGNVATIMGVRGGLEAIRTDLRRPVNDFLACSSVVGSLNIQDIPYGACYVAKQAWRLAEEPLPSKWKEIIEQRIDSCHFEFPGSTHSLHAAVEPQPSGSHTCGCTLYNTEESAHTGTHSLKIMAKRVGAAQQITVFKQCYLAPSDFDDSRYDPAFSPLLYPGQTIHGSAFLPAYGGACRVCLYARNARTGEMYHGEPAVLEKEKWAELCYAIPALDGVLLSDAGFLFELLPRGKDSGGFAALVDDLYFDGQPSYRVEFIRETTEWWTDVHREVSQFTRLKGNFYLQDGKANLSCADLGEVYTGRYDWTDYSAEFTMEPILGDAHYACFRVQGGIRSYQAGLAPGGRFVLLKNTRAGLVTLAETPFDWRPGRDYTIRVTARGNQLCAETGTARLTFRDEDRPYLSGGIGLSVRNGSHMRCQFIRVC